MKKLIYIFCFLLLFLPTKSFSDDKILSAFELSFFNSYTSSIFYFDFPIGFGFAGTFYKDEPDHKDYSGTMSTSSYIARLDSDVGDEYMVESSSTGFTLNLSFNIYDLILSLMHFKVNLIEYQDKYDSYHMLSPDGYYSVPTGKKTTKNAMYYSLSYPFYDFTNTRLAGGLSYNTYENKLNFVLGLRLCTPSGCF